MISDWVIFGASIKGEAALRSAPERSWIGFIDNNPSKWGTVFCGLPVMSLSEYQRRLSYAGIVIASQYETEIVEQLLDSNIVHFELYWSAFTSNLENSANSEGFQEFCLDQSLGKHNEQLTLLVQNNSGSNTLALQKTNALRVLGCKVRWHHDAIRSQAYIEDIFTSKYVGITHDKVLPSTTNVIQLWHGFPMKGLNNMSRFQPAETREKTRSRWLEYNAIASYSPMYTTLMNACYGVNIEQYFVTGMPRNDLLFLKQPEVKLEALAGRHLNGRRVVLYMPTFRKTKFGQVNGDEELQIFGLREFDREALYTFLDENQLVLVVKPHPYHEDDFGLGTKDDLPECVWVITDTPLMELNVDFYETLAAADLLITDYSSVYFDYLLLDKPIVFTPSDALSYSESRGFLIEPYEFWAPGPQCFEQDKLQYTIITQLENPAQYSKERERVRRIVHHYEDNESSARVAALIGRIMSD